MTNPHVIARWLIMDYSGRAVLEGKGDYTAMIQTSVCTIPMGIYILRAFDQSGQVYAGKLVKK